MDHPLGLPGHKQYLCIEREREREREKKKNQEKRELKMAAQLRSSFRSHVSSTPCIQNLYANEVKMKEITVPAGE